MLILQVCCIHLAMDMCLFAEYVIGNAILELENSHFPSICVQEHTCCWHDQSCDEQGPIPSQAMCSSRLRGARKQKPSSSVAVGLLCR